jgi:long-chain-fatty-acyl-CoA reductase
MKDPMTASASRSTRPIPFIIGGRRVVPSEDSLQSLALDTGHDIQLPRLTPALVEEVLALDRFLLRDVPLYDIISFLNNVGNNWKSDEYPRRRTYVRQLVDCLGYSEKMAENEANWIALILSSHFRFHDTIAAELGSRHILDGWVQGEEAEVRAFPRGRSLHILAGNVPLGGVVSIMRALITKNLCVVKMSSKDPFTAVALALSFQDVDSLHVLSRALNVVHWSSDQEASSKEGDRLLQASDSVLVWGGREAIEWAARRAPPSAEVIKFGPRRSLAVIGRDADRRKAARALAHDVSMYDQRACFSVQQVFVEGDHSALVDELKLALEHYSTLVPKGHHDFDERAVWSLAKLEATFLGADVIAGQGQDWSIVHCPPGWIEAHPLGRTIYVHSIPRLEAVAEYIDEEVQTVAVYPWSRGRDIRDLCGAAGASRIVELGINNVFRPGGTHDGMYSLQRLVRLVSHEASAEVHPKGITIPIDLTKFFEEDRFSEFIPG